MSATRAGRGPGRAVARVGVALLAFGALAGLLLPGAASAVQTTPASGVPASASSDAVMQALGVDPNPPAELVFLVDTSDSMQSEGLYSKVVDQLTEYFQTLAQQEPQDEVAVITVGQGDANALVYGPGAPPEVIGLPATAHGGTTDFGAAFSIALTQLADAPADIKVGGVVLLSDGGMSAPHDTLYDGGKGYSAPGWAQLHTRAQNLNIPVTGYAVPLTSNESYIQDQDQALSEVFPAVRTLPGGTSNLEGALSVAADDVAYGQVVGLTSGDSGKGIAVSWSGLPANLNLQSPGHASVKVTLTARTSKVPLYVTGLRVDSPGQPISVTGVPPAESLRAGQSVSFTATLSWPSKTVGRSLFGGVHQEPSHLVLSGSVGSPWSRALSSTFNETNFTPGQLTGSSAAYGATELKGNYLRYLLLPLIVLIVLLILLLLSTLMTGTLILSDVDGGTGRAVLLPVFPVLWFGTGSKLGIRGRMRVRGLPFRRGMSVTVSLAGRRRGTGHMRSGSRAIVGGIDIVHLPLFPRSPRSPYGR